MVAEGQRQQEKRRHQQRQTLRPPEPSVERGQKHPDQQSMQRVNLRDHGLRPHRGAECEEQRHAHRSHEIQPAPASDPLAEHPSGGTRKKRRREARGNGSAQAAEEIDLPSRVAEWQKLKNPRQQGPERVSRGVGDSKMLRGDNEFTRVEQGDIGRSSPKIHCTRKDHRDRCGPPVCTRPNPLRPGRWFFHGDPGR